jgi:hypothetical protein
VRGWDPQTGEHWAESAVADLVPLTWDVWAYMAFRRDRGPVRRAGAVPGDAFRDDAAPLNPFRTFRPDRGLLVSTLARLPEVRQPWLRQIYDHVNDQPYGYPF